HSFEKAPETPHGRRVSSIHGLRLPCATRPPGPLPHTGGVVDWAGTFEREAGRYRDGESRLGDGTDERQRQLTRMGNAAWGAALCLLMQGADAREWLVRSASRWRESYAEAPPGSWGRPIGAIKALVLAGD